MVFCQWRLTSKSEASKQYALILAAVTLECVAVVCDVGITPGCL